jgi:predicted  nucleic acid-binding Zn-ribbon protein
MNDKPGGTEVERLRAQILERDQTVERLQRDLNAQRLAIEEHRTASVRWQNAHTQIARELSKARAQRNLAWSAAGVAALIAGFAGKRLRF